LTKDVFHATIASSLDGKNILRQAKALRQLLSHIPVNKDVLSDIWKNAKTIAIASAYAKHQDIEGHRVCPITFQWGAYFQSLTRIVERLKKSHKCSGCVDPGSPSFEGPVISKESKKEMSYGVAKFFNYQSINKIDYYPPHNCLPSSSGSPLIVKSDAIPALSFEINYEKELHRISTVIDCSYENEVCQDMQRLDESHIVTFYVMQDARILYEVKVAGFSYKITPKCAAAGKTKSLRRLFAGSNTASSTS
jgi:hypothetical protein